MSKNTKNSDDVKITIAEITYDPAYPAGNTALQFPSMLGVQVEAGNLIGHSGTKGVDHDFAEHLHFEIRQRIGEGGPANAEGTGYDHEIEPTTLYYLNPEFYFLGQFKYKGD